MPASKTKQGPTSALALDDLRARVDRLRRDVEDAVETLGKRAVEILPDGRRKQVDDVLDRISAVRGDVNKAVDSWRSDIEKRFKVVRGTVDKRVTTLRKETENRSKRLAGSVEKQTRRYVSLLFKRLHLPVRNDIDALKRRIGGLERRLEQLEKSAKRAA